MSDAKESSADKAFDLKVDKDEPSGYEYVIYSLNRSIKAVGITDGHNFTRESCFRVCFVWMTSTKKTRKEKEKTSSKQFKPPHVSYSMLICVKPR